MLFLLIWRSGRQKGGEDHYSQQRIQLLQHLKDGKTLLAYGYTNSIDTLYFFSILRSGFDMQYGGQHRVLILGEEKINFSRRGWGYQENCPVFNYLKLEHFDNNSLQASNPALVRSRLPASSSAGRNPSGSLNASTNGLAASSATQSDLVVHFLFIEIQASSSVSLALSDYDPRRFTILWPGAYRISDMFKKGGSSIFASAPQKQKEFCCALGDRQAYGINIGTTSDVSVSGGSAVASSPGREEVFSDRAVLDTAHAVRRVTAYIYDKRFDCIIISGGSANFTRRLFMTAWRAMYPSHDMPRLLIMGVHDNYEFFGVGTVTRPEDISKKLIARLARFGNVAYLDNLSITGIKNVIIKNRFEIINIKLCFIVFCDSGFNIQKPDFYGSSGQSILNILNELDIHYSMTARLDGNRLSYEGLRNRRSMRLDSHPHCRKDWFKRAARHARKEIEREIERLNNFSHSSSPIGQSRRRRLDDLRKRLPANLEEGFGYSWRWLDYSASSSAGSASNSSSVVCAGKNRTKSSFLESSSSAGITVWSFNQLFLPSRERLDLMKGAVGALWPDLLLLQEVTEKRGAYNSAVELARVLWGEDSRRGYEEHFTRRASEGVREGIAIVWSRALGRIGGIRYECPLFGVGKRYLLGVELQHISSGQKLFVFTTHLDLLDADRESRLAQLKRARAYIYERVIFSNLGAFVIFGGDFNFWDVSEIEGTGSELAQCGFVDSEEVAAPGRFAFTYKPHSGNPHVSDFDREHWPPRGCDRVYVRSGGSNASVATHEIIDEVSGNYLSDHSVVQITLQVSSSKRPTLGSSPATRQLLASSVSSSPQANPNSSSSAAGQNELFELLPADTLWGVLRRALPEEAAKLESNFSCAGTAGVVVSMNARLFASFDDIAEHLRELAGRGIRPRYIYLIGVYQESELSRKINQDLEDDINHHLCFDRDEQGRIISAVRGSGHGCDGLLASAFSIPDHLRPNPDMGGLKGLSRLFSAANAMGIKILPDLVVHSTAIDCVWLRDERLQAGDLYWYVYKELPGYYSERLSALDQARNLPHKDDHGRWNCEHVGLVELLDEIIGKNPGYFPHYSTKLARWVLIAFGANHTLKESRPQRQWWPDIALLDLTNPEVRSALIDTAAALISYGAGGFRADCAMAAIKEGERGFLHTWYQDHFCGWRDVDYSWPRELWAELIEAARELNPEAFFIAEAFWFFDELIACGFSVISQNHPFNLLNRHVPDIDALRGYLRSEPIQGQRRRVNGITSHDDELCMTRYHSNYPSKVGIILRSYFLLLATIPGLLIIPWEHLEGYFARATAAWYALEHVDRPRKQLRGIFEGIFSVAADPLFHEGELWVFNTHSHQYHSGIMAHARYREHQGRRRVALVVGNHFDSLASGYVSLGEAAAQLGIETGRGDYYALIDRLTGEVYLRTGEELCNRGLYVELPAHQSHIFMIQELRLPADGAILRRMHSQSSGKAVGLDDIMILIKDCGLRLDFFAQGPIKKALALVLLQGRFSPADLNKLLTGPEAYAGEFVFEGGGCKNKVAGIMQDFAGNEPIQRFSRILRIAGRFFPKAFAGKAVYFTVCQKGTKVWPGEHGIYVQIGPSSPEGEIWEVNSLEAIDQIRRALGVLDVNYAAEHSEAMREPNECSHRADAAAILRNLFLLFDQAVFEAIWQNRASFRQDALTTYFAICAGKRRLMQYIKEILLDSDYFWYSRAIVVRVVSLADTGLQKKLLRLAQNSRAHSHVQSSIYKVISCAGTGAAKDSLRSFLIQRIRERIRRHRRTFRCLRRERQPLQPDKPSDSFDVCLEAAVRFPDDRMLARLLIVFDDLLESRDTQAGLAEGLGSMAIFDRNPEYPVFAGFLEAVRGLRFFRQRAALTAALKAIGITSEMPLMELWQSQLVDTITRTKEGPGSYFIYFYLWRVARKLERPNRALSKSIVAALMSKAHLPWITAIDGKNGSFVDIGNLSPIKGQVEILRPLLEPVIAEISVIIGEIWSLGQSWVYQPPEVSGPFLDFLSQLEEFSVNYGSDDTRKTALSAIARFWFWRYRHLQNQSRRSVPDFMRSESELMRLASEVADYDGELLLAAIEAAGIGYQHCPTGSKEARIRFLIDATGIAPGRVGMASFRASRVLVQLGHPAPPGVIEGILESIQDFPYIMPFAVDGKGIIGTMDFVFRELNALADAKYKFTPAMISMIKGWICYTWDNPCSWYFFHYQDMARSFLQRVQDEGLASSSAVGKGDIASNCQNSSSPKSTSMDEESLGKKRGHTHFQPAKPNSSSPSPSRPGSSPSNPGSRAFSAFEELQRTVSASSSSRFRKSSSSPPMPSSRRPTPGSSPATRQLLVSSIHRELDEKEGGLLRYLRYDGSSSAAGGEKRDSSIFASSPQANLAKEMSDYNWLARRLGNQVVSCIEVSFKEVIDNHRWQGFRRLYEAAGANAGFLFSWGLPTLLRSFGIGWINKNWQGIISLGETAGANAGFLFHHALPLFKNMITDGQSLQRIGSILINLGKAAGDDECLLFQKGLPLFRDMITDGQSLQSIGSDLINLIEAAGNNKLYLLDHGLPALLRSFGIKWINKNWQGIISLGQAVGVQSWLLFYRDLPALLQSFGIEWINKNWQGIISLGQAVGVNSSLFFWEGSKFLSQAFDSEGNLIDGSINTILRKVLPKVSKNKALEGLDHSLIWLLSKYSSVGFIRNIKLSESEIETLNSKKELFSAMVVADDCLKKLSLEGLALGTQSYIKLLLVEFFLARREEGLEEFLSYIGRVVIPGLRDIEEATKQYPTLGMEIQPNFGEETERAEAISEIIFANYLASLNIRHNLGPSGMTGKQSYQLRLAPTVFPVFIIFVEKFFKLLEGHALLARPQPYLTCLAGDYFQESPLLLTVLFYTYMPEWVRVAVPGYTSAQIKNLGVFPSIGDRYVGATFDPWTGKLLDKALITTRGTQTNFFSALAGSHLIRGANQRYNVKADTPAHLRKAFLLAAAAGAYLNHGTKDRNLANLYEKFRGRLFKLLEESAANNGTVGLLFNQPVEEGRSLEQARQSLIPILQKLDQAFQESVGTKSLYSLFREEIELFADEVEDYLFPPASLRRRLVPIDGQAIKPVSRKCLINCIFDLTSLPPDKLLAWQILKGRYPGQADIVVAKLEEEANSGNHVSLRNLGIINGNRFSRQSASPLHPKSSNPCSGFNFPVLDRFHHLIRLSDFGFIPYGARNQTLNDSQPLSRVPRSDYFLEIFRVGKCFDFNCLNRSMLSMELYWNGYPLGGINGTFHQIGANPMPIYSVGINTCYSGPYYRGFGLGAELYARFFLRLNDICNLYNIPLARFDRYYQAPSKQPQEERFKNIFYALGFALQKDCFDYLSQPYRRRAGYGGFMTQTPDDLILRIRQSGRCLFYQSRAGRFLGRDEGEYMRWLASLREEEVEAEVKLGHDAITLFAIQPQLGREGVDMPSLQNYLDDNFISFYGD